LLDAGWQLTFQWAFYIIAEQGAGDVFTVIAG
jgi:hypothetical protein